jgi:hypothetical protein
MKVFKRIFWILVIITIFSLILSSTRQVKAPSENLPASAPTLVGGSISSDTIWDFNHSPYVVTSDITVESNVTLTIEPNVVVKFAGYYNLLIKGNLNAIGSQSASVIFTSNSSSPAVGDWKGIQAYDNYSVMTFQNALVEYADTGIYNNDGNITIVDSEISFNDVGIYYSQSSYSNMTHGEITDNIIKANGIGVQIDVEYGPSGNMTLENNTIVSNDEGLRLYYFNREGFNVSITQNIISLNGLGVRIEGGVRDTPSVDMAQNYITFNNGTGIFLNLGNRAATTVFSIADNDIHSNAQYDFKLGDEYITPHTDYTFNVSGNYWGTNIPALIDDQIYDFNDDHKLGKVSYSPTIDSPLESRYPGLSIDHVLPTVSISSPLNNTYSSSSNVSITWSGSDAGSGVDHYAIKLNDTSAIDVGIIANYTFQNLSEGVYAMRTLSFDKKGNVGEALVNFTVDLTPPIISNVSVVNGSVIRTSGFNITWSGSDGVSGIDHYEIKLDTDEWVNVANQTCYNVTRLSDGSHTITIRAFDKAQNYGEATFSLVVNTSLLFGPGLTDDAAFFGGIGLAVVICVYYFGFVRRKKTKISQVAPVSSTITQ